MTSSSIGRYQLVEEIGRGGMASVYRAHDPLFKRDVAIKVMTQDLLKDPNLKARFEREAQTIAALEHPAIVPVYDFGEEGGRPYLVMRLMTGMTLSEKLKQGPLSIVDTSAILTRIGSALDRAHKQGIVHRDLKPSNIMFDDYGDAFLADFGIARLTESAVTLTGDSVLGTPAYMSPEQIHGDKSIDGRSDIYALGVICFEMLTGERPFVDKTPTKVMMKHILDPVPNIRDVNPELPNEVNSVIVHSMAKDPNERYNTSQELTDTLQTLARAGFGVTAGAAAPKGEPEDLLTETESPGAETQLEGAEKTEVDVPEPPGLDPSQDEALAAGEEYPETEVVVPSFVGRRQAEGQFAPPYVEEDLDTAGAPIDEEIVPETEIAVPSFVSPSVAAEPALAESKEGAKRNWILIGGIGMVVVVAIIAVVAGGIFIISQSSEDEEAEGLVSTATAQVAARPTSRTGSTSTVSAVDVGGALVIRGDALLEQFYDKWDAGDLDGAMAAIEEAISLVPDNTWYQYERADFLFESGDLDGALEAIDQAIDNDPDEGPYYELRGLLLHELGDLYAALENLQRAAELGSDNESAFDELADSLMEEEDFGAAIAAYDHAININPNNEDYYGSRSWAFELFGDYGAAAADLEEAISLNPDALWAYEQLADLYMWVIEDLDGAIEVWSRVIDKDPENGSAYVLRGEILREIGDLEGALEDIQRAIEIEPNNYWFHLQLAKTYDYLEEPDRALDEYNLAVELNPGDPEIYYDRANFYRWTVEDFDQALADYTKAIELDPEASWYYADRASLHRDLGDFEASLADLEMGISVDPHDSWLYIEKASTFADIGEIEASLEEYNRAIEVEPGNPSAYYYRANVFANDLGDYDAAFADYERCLEVDPMMPWCYLDWGWALDDIGDIDGAISKFLKFIEFVPPFDCPECVEEVEIYIDENS
jgi:serine/threonine-protein kinase